MAKKSGFDSQEEQVIVPFSTVSRPVLRSVHPPGERQPGAVSARVQLEELEAELLNLEQR
jgi:hypothetical protein